MSSVCNQLPMVSVLLKKTDNVTFDKPLANYIKREFDAKTAETHKPLIQDLTQSREELRFCDRLERNETTRQRLLRYLKFVNSIDSRFPISESGIRIQFYWYDPYSSKRANHYSMALEKAGWVYQLAALESQIASTIDRRSDEGLKNACRYFCIAAGTFAFLRELVQSKPSVMSTGDLTPEFCAIAESLMLAQAQECFFVKAEIANMKPGVLSKLAAECSNMYARAFTMVSTPGRQSVDKTWLPFLQIRHAMYQGLANYYVGVDLGQAEKYGEQVAYLTRSVQYLCSPNLQKALSLSPPILVSEFQNRINIVRSAHASAANDNSKIYHERVPTELPPIEGKAMVKSIEFQDQFFSPDQDPFGRLIPVAVTAALNSYNEKKTQMVTLLLNKIEESNAAAKSNLNAMGLPGSILALDGGGLPKEILDRVRDFKQIGGVSTVLESINRRNDLAARCEQLIQDAERILDQEEAEEATLTNQYKGRWNRTPSHHLTVAQRQEILRHKGNLTHAKKSDAIVQKKLEAHLPTLTALSGSDAEAQALLPRGATSSLTNHPSVVRLKELLKQLDDVLSQREEIDSNIKSTRDKDDITQALLSSSMIDATVTTELSKYDVFQQQIQSNVTRQNEIMQALASSNAEFAAAKGSESAGSQREAVFQQIGNALSLAHELRGNLKEGVQFYTDFQTVLSKLKSYCDSFAAARCAEKEEIISSLRLDSAPQFQPQFQPQQPQSQTQFQPQFQPQQPQFQSQQPQSQPPPGTFIPSSYQPPASSFVPPSYDPSAPFVPLSGGPSSSSSSAPPGQPPQFYLAPQGLPPGFSFLPRQ